MEHYLRLLEAVKNYGETKQTHDGNVLSLHQTHLSFDMTEGFPAVTTKKLYFNSVAAELAGFLHNVDSAAEMRKLGTSIWDANANNRFWQDNPNCKGLDDLGRTYGQQWRSWRKDSGTVDQIQKAIEQLKHDPQSRRIIVTAWNPSELDRVCLPPCHIFFQYLVRRKHHLDCLVYMRSADLFLGVPFNIASYALLMSLIGKQVNYAPGVLSIVIGDCHIYVDHLPQIQKQLNCDPLPKPTLKITEEATIDNFMPFMVKLIDYHHHPALSATMNMGQ